MVQSPALAQSIFVSYFILILSLFWLILNSLKQLGAGLHAKPRQAFVFLGLALGSLCHTWFYMIKFLLWSFHDFEARRPVGLIEHASVLDRMTGWLMGSDLFEQAWRRVCERPMNWWWSEQLCIVTVGVWTAFLFIQGSRRRIPHVWAYMLLGQVVAISVASNLFFAAVVLRRASSTEPGSKHPLKRGAGPHIGIPPRVYLPIFVSHLTILISPTVAHPNSKWFLPNLLAIHILIVLPLLIPSKPIPNTTTPRFYLLLAALALVPRAQTYLSLPALDISGLIQTLHEHPAQSSIGYDVLWTTASFAVYCAIARGLDVSRGVLGILSPGLALCLDDQRD